MSNALKEIRRRMGDLWWYSAMMFFACRATDLLNAFVGLWLVPKFVSPAELGAVAPLGTLVSVIAVPATAFANAFRNEVARLSAAREFGRLKSLMRGVFAATALFLAAMIALARLAMPLFLERIRIAEGSLGFVIAASAFAGALAPVYTNALHSLKKFKAQSVINLLGAPVRAAVMLAAMPFRAITGYFVGQASVPAFNMAASVFFLRKEMSVRAEPYWSRAAAVRFARLFAAFAAIASVSGLCNLVEATVLRQRLPDLDSAGYYMASRFSEIACYLFTALVVAIFPMAAELADRPRERARLVARATLGNFAFCAAVAAVFWFFGRRILGCLPHGEEYAAYWWAVPWMCASSALAGAAALFTTAETAAYRFGFLKFTIPVDAAYAALLLAVTGFGYYADALPASWAEFLSAHNIRSLDTMLWWMTAANAARALACLAAARLDGGKARQSRP